MNTLIKPAVEMLVKSSDCGLMIVVNGCQLVRDNTGDPIDLTQVINPFVRSGKNEFEVLLLLGPANEPNVSKLHFEVRVREVAAPPGTGALLTRVVYDGLLASAGKATSASSPPGQLLSADGYREQRFGDVTVGPLEVDTLPPPFTNNSPALRRTIDLPLPLPTWAFFKGDFMPAGWSKAPPTTGVERQMYDGLMKSYQELWRALAAKNGDRLRTLFAERSREYDRALFLVPGTTWSQCFDRIRDMWKDGSGQLASIDDEGQPWLVEARTDRMRTTFLAHGSHASHILRYVTEDNDACTYAQVLPVWFRREGSKFIVTR
jgi:hypothetical protein